MRVIVCGLIAQYPLGGVAWDYLQYAIGLKKLGVEVYYFEDTGQWPFNPHEEGVSKGCAFNVEYLSALMERYGLGQNWAYRFPHNNQWFGMSEERVQDICASASVLLNISGCLRDPDAFRAVRTLAYVDSDPIFTQIKILKRQSTMIRNLERHDIHFSFGEAVADGTATIADTGFAWHPTRQPIVLEEWHSAQQRYGYTTIMNWTSYKDIEFEGRVFGQKDGEFRRFLSLPTDVADVRFDVALNDGKTRRSPKPMLERNGWHILDPNEVCPDLDTYRDFIAASRAEWSVAKNGYVEGRSGWFSCRSACYLAAGRPVVVQSTGFEPYVPTGEGVLSFREPGEAIAAIKAVERDYDMHAEAARSVAESHFEAGRVLGDMLDRCGC